MIEVLIQMILAGPPVESAEQMPQGKMPSPHPSHDEWAMWQVIGAIVGAAITTAGTVFVAWLGFKGRKRS